MKAIRMKEAIRYEIECRFCKDRLDGASSPEAQMNIAIHDVSHKFCGRCREVRVTVPDATLCDDCFADTEREYERVHHATMPH